MAERKSEDSGRERPGLGFQDLSMNVVPAAAPGESEAPQRGSRAWPVVLGVLAAAVLLVLGARLIRNAAPGQDAEARLRERLMALPIWQQGTVVGARYLAGNAVRLEFSQRLSMADQEQRDVVRQATRDVFVVLRAERPHRDLYMDGYQGDRRIARGEYRHKSTLVGPSGEQVPDITVKVEGDPEGGMGGAYSSRARPTAGR